MNAKRLATALCACAAGLCMATEATVAEGAYLSVSTSVPETLRFESGGTLRKTGSSALAVMTDGFSGGGWSVEAVGGSLSVATGVNRSFTKPTAILNKAAFWVDSAVNVVRNGDDVIAWRDAREIDPDTDTYPRATSQTNLTNACPQYVASGAGVDGDLPSIWFGRLASGRWMQFSIPLNVRHVFVVHGVTESFGNILGSTASPPEKAFLAGDLSSAKGTLFWHNSRYSAPVCGRVFLDRVRVDPTAAHPNDGWQLMEIDLPYLGTLNAFFNDRSLANYTPFGNCWAGGDNICEAVFFTVFLTESERLQVADYLWRKWRSRAADMPEMVVSYNGSDVAVTYPPGTDVSLPAIPGGGTMYFGAASLSEMGVTLETPTGHAPVGLGAGTSLSPVYLPHAVLARTGTVYTVRSDGEDGVIAATAAASASAIVKDGTGTLLLEKVPQGVSTLEVTVGELRLQPPARPAVAPENLLCVIEDGDFEKFSPNWSDNKRYIFFDDTSACGWAYAKASTTYHVQIPCNGSAMPGWTGMAAAPSGVQFASLQKDFSLSTEMDVPADGIYTLSFRLAQRPGVGWHRIDVLVDGTVLAQVVANTDVFRTLRYRLPRLVAGKHTVAFQSADTDNASGLDDVRVDWIRSGDNEVAVSNAGFEIGGVFEKDVRDVATAPTGWAISGTGGVAMLGSWKCPAAADGDRVLWLNCSASATTPIAFPSAGRYALYAAVARARPDSSYGDPKVTQLYGSFYVDGALLNSVATGCASVPAERFLGVYTASEGNLTVPFTVSNALSLATAAILTVDAVRVVRLPANLLTNGGFEEGQGGSASWELDASKYPEFAGYARTVVVPYAENPSLFGSDVYEGANRLRVFHRGWARQTLTFPSEGDYRFIAHTCARNYNGYAAGRNPVEVRLCRNGVTNAIGTVSSYDGAFRRYTLPFRIDEPGAYTLELQGLGEDNEDKTTFFDGLSVEPIDESRVTDSLIPADAEVVIAAGARIRLDFTGTNKVAAVRYSGHSVSGVIDVKQYPEFVSGSGALYVMPEGTVVIIR